MNILQEFNNKIKTNDYVGAANYLRSIKFNDKNRNDALLQQAAILERYGGIATAILDKEQNSDKKDLLSFNLSRLAGNFGAIDETTGRWKNRYANQYVDYITNLGNKDKRYAQYIDITFNDQDTYNKFVDTSGLQYGNKADDDQKSPYTRVEDGKTILRLNKQALLDGEFFDKFTSGLLAAKTQNMYATTSWGQVIHLADAGGFTVSSYDYENKPIDSWSDFDDNLRGAYDLSRTAKENYEATMNKYYDRVIPSQLMASGFMCGAQKQITEAAFAGQLDSSQANFMLSQIDAYYNNLLSHESLTEYDVYATDPNSESMNLEEIDDPALKGEYTKIMRAAAKEGRLKVAAGTSGGRVGAVITISAKIDKDGNLGKGADADYQFFVPGLLDEDARNVIDEDVNAKILVEKSEHIAFGHQYDLSEGGRLINFQGDGSAIYQDDTGEVYKTPEEVDKLMLRNEMVKGGIQMLKNSIFEDNLTDKQVENLATEYATKIFDFTEEKEPTKEEGEKEASVKHTNEELISIQNLVQRIIEEAKK